MYISMSVGYTTLARNDIRSALDYYGARHDTPSYGQLVEDATAQIVAYCTSEDCCRYWKLDKHGHKKLMYKKEVHKEVDKSHDDCPQCGCALLWKKANWVRRL